MTTSAINPSPCRYCGMHHAAKCSLVKAMEYHPDGSLKRVEFYEPTRSPVVGGGGGPVRVGNSRDPNIVYDVTITGNCGIPHSYDVWVKCEACKTPPSPFRL